MRKHLNRISQSEGLLLRIDRSGGKSIQSQIVERVVALIKQGTLLPGSIMPASRRLADTLGINRTTVVKAYLDLWSLGYLDSRPGSYTRVRKRAELATPKVREISKPFDWTTRVNTAGEQAYRQIQNDQLLAVNGGGRPVATEAPGELIDFTPHFYQPDDGPPLNEFRKCLNLVLANRGPELVGTFDPKGHEPLRQYVARRLARYDISVNPDEIMITGGLMDSLELLTKTLIRPGTAVLVEAPTAGGISALLRFYQSKVIDVPMTANGLNLAVLGKILDTTKPAFLLTMPNFQVPTGIVTSQSHREELLTMCERYQLPIVESGFEEELAYFGKATLPVKSIDRHQLVVHLGTFSRVLMVGAQVGWVAASQQLIDRLAAVKEVTGSPNSCATQAALVDFCQRGRYDVYVKRVLVAFRKRMQITIRLLREHLSDELTWIEPGGGYVVWLKTKRRLRGTTSEQLFRKHGVAVSAGRFFHSGPNDEQYFRISISSVSQRQIAEGIKRIAKALKTQDWSPYVKGLPKPKT